MNRDHDNLSERERRLGEIVFAYLQAVENGQPLCQRELLARHPQFAVELKEFLADEHLVHVLTQPLRPGAGAPCPNPVLPGDLPTFGMRGTATVAMSLGPLSVPYGDYELLEELGRGGMAVVYKARQKGLDRMVALKMIRTDRVASATDLQRFRHEIEAVANLDHPHIAPIYAVGQCDGNQSYFFTSKLIENGSLDRHLARFRDDPRATVRVLIGAASAICHAHRQGILHRDLKPSNILLDVDDQPLVIDFGLAKHVEANLDFTRSGELVGTPPYMAPEQVRGRTEQITAATDIYGLGAVLYTLLTGRPPFQPIFRTSRLHFR
ncbi:MAG: serine/threonine-protein kinase [Pirellulaceae bacterium]